MLSDLRDAIDEDRTNEARKLIADLREKTEGDDPEVFRLEQLLLPEVGEEGVE